jgi:hypothetical protein
LKQKQETLATKDGSNVVFVPSAFFCQLAIVFQRKE